MKITLALLTVLGILLTPSAHAVYEINRSDVKFATQAVPEKQEFTNPAAAGTTNVLSGNAGNTSAAAATVTSFVAQPDVPRSLVITPGTSTVDVAQCTITVSGSDILGNSMSETFWFGNNGSSASTGSLAFASVSSVSFPANCEDGNFAATWSIGYGEKLGVKRCMGGAGDILFSTLNGAKEGTAPTMVAGSSVAGTTADFNGSMDGSSDFVLYFFQNFTCLP